MDEKNDPQAEQSKDSVEDTPSTRLTWQGHLKDYASKNAITYKEAMGNEECREQWKLVKPPPAKRKPAAKKLRKIDLPAEGDGEELKSSDPEDPETPKVGKLKRRPVKKNLCSNCQKEIYPEQQ